MDKTAFFTMPSGLYVVSAAADGAARRLRHQHCGAGDVHARRASRLREQGQRHFGCRIAAAKAFALTVIDQTADMLYIGNFGFRTSSDYDKFVQV